MSEKFLCAVATFDNETSRSIKEIYNSINAAGFVGEQTPNLPYHITLAYFDTWRESEILDMLQRVSEKTKSFDISFNHIGLFGLRVLFLAPNVNYELLDLHKFIGGDDQSWVAHTTLLIEDAEVIHKALPIVADNFQKITGRVEGVSLYEFFPTRLIGKFNLI